MELLREQYEARIEMLERRLSELESGSVVPLEDPTDDPLEALRVAAREAAGTTVPEEDSAPQVEAQAAPTAMGGERNLNRLNPEISFTGDLLARASSQGRDEFEAREFELALQSALDPFSSARLFVSIGPGGEVDLEEGYIAYYRLPGGLSLKGGRFRQDFGLINRWHLHALPFSDYPLVLRTFFGEEGLSQTGLSLDWLLPHSWASANELSLQITNGENDAFGGGSFDHLAALIHFKNYWDLDPATYFEWGLSGIGGESTYGGDSRAFGTDLTLHWQPPSRAKYREITFRTEIMFSQRDDELQRRQDAWGLYSYLESLVARNLYLGFQYDWVEDPYFPEYATEGLTANVSWWQSEFVRLRGQYSYFDREVDRQDESRFLLQVTFAAGPHKHEAY